MRIALYLKHFPPAGAPLKGGIAIAVDWLATGLSENGAEVTVLCEGGERTSARTAAGYTIECFPTLVPYRSFEIAPALRDFAEQQLVPQRAVCPVNGMFDPGVYAMGRVFDRLGVPYVAVPHDPYDRAAFHEPDYERTSPEIIGDHDIFCLPSRLEGFGLAALEAMLAGRVLLVSEGAGIGRHVLASRCGVTVRPTASGVEQGLIALLRRRGEWREMGLNGRRYALANLQWKQVAAAALQKYARLAA